MFVRKLHAGMGQAVAERTILRKKEDNTWETWGDVAERVALGNSLLCKNGQKTEYGLLKKHISKATLLTSGRHLQHGDESQPTRNMEVFTNCATASNSFMLFYLLMNGSGVGRCYDDDIMLANWDYAPNLRCVLDENHPDFDFSAHESSRDAKHKYKSGKEVLWHVVEDTREGWANALEVWENATFQKIHSDKMLILDFSNVRAKGTPIKGMQGRPASGPVPLMNAFNKASTLKGGGLPRWLQAMYIDHYFAECVLVGGARRAARMSVKTWRDKSVLDFIVVKRPIEYDDKKVEEIVGLRKIANPQGFLWSSNNSILVDEEFWNLINLKKTDEKYKSELARHARKVFKLATAAAYADGTGEPGFINQDKLVDNKKGIEEFIRTNNYLGSKKYQINEESEIYVSRLLKKIASKKYAMIVNPCLPGDTWILTSDGPKRINELINKPFDAIVNGKAYPASGFWCTGEKQTFNITTSRGYSIKATDNHKFLVERARKQKLSGGYNSVKEWVEVKQLEVGDKLILSNNCLNSWSGDGTFNEGWLIGEIVGDGGFNKDSYGAYLRFWGENKSEMADFAIECIKSANLKTRSDFVGKTYNEINDTIQTECAALTKLSEIYISSKDKNALLKLEKTSSDFYRGFIRGLFDADGTVLDNQEKGRSVRLGQNNIERLELVQRMLSRLGIACSIYKNRKEAGFRSLPDSDKNPKDYFCKSNHELCISKDNMVKFENLIGFTDKNKSEKLKNAIESITRGVYHDSFTTEVESIEPSTVELVYDCTVDEVHCFDANGIIAHNCGEISIIMWGAFCTIADIVPFYCDAIDEFEEAARVAVRAMIRVNTMDSVYKKEVNRTNRIGIGLTGVHEFAWKFFKFGFRDLLDEEKSKEFWLTLSRIKRAIQQEAAEYSTSLGVEIPHTDTTIKPSGTVSKLFGLTEGWHLPTMKWYVRWVQFRIDDPLVEQYRKAGYPTKELVQYKNTVIIGFPTTPIICDLMSEDEIVTAAEATPEEQYKWLMLGEKYWIRGTTEDGQPLAVDTGNQISYTLKYNPNIVEYKDFVDTIKQYQSKVKCCSIMPQEENSSYEYLPEQPVTKAEYESVVRKIQKQVEEDVDFAHVDCAAGACPIDFKK